MLTPFSPAQEDSAIGGVLRYTSFAEAILKYWKVACDLHFDPMRLIGEYFALRAVSLSSTNEDLTF
jgi:hypothetical protein